MHKEVGSVRDHKNKINRSLRPIDLSRMGEGPRPTPQDAPLDAHRLIAELRQIAAINQIAPRLPRSHYRRW